MPTLKNITMFWHTVRLVIYALFVKKAGKSIKGFKGNKKALLALFFGSIVYKILNKVLDLILVNSMRLKQLKTIDEFWLYDSKEVNANVAGLMKVDKFDF